MVAGIVLDSGKKGTVFNPEPEIAGSIGSSLPEGTSVAQAANQNMVQPFKTSPMKVRQAKIAASRYELIIELGGPDEEVELAMFRLANTYYAILEDFDNAAFYFQKLINDYPKGKKIGSAYVLLSETYFKMDDYDSEMRVYTTMMQEYSKKSKEYAWALKHSTTDRSETSRSQ